MCYNTDGDIMKKIICWVLVIVLVITSLFTVSEFGSISPVTFMVGAFRVLVLGQDYARASLLPRAYLTRPHADGTTAFLDAMAQWGYTHHPEEQMGRLHWFTTKDGEWFKVVYTCNAYYGKWVWC